MASTIAKSALNTGHQSDQHSQSSSEDLNEGSNLLKNVPSQQSDFFDDWPEDGDRNPCDVDDVTLQPDARRVYGGSNRTRVPSNAKGVFEVATDVAASCLPASPLLMPYAFYLTGLAIGIPLLFFLAALSWFSHTILAVEGRYVGAVSLNGLAASVFPRRFGGQAASELIVDLLTIFVSIGRSAIVLAISSHLIASVLKAIAPRILLLHNTNWLSIITALAFLIPSLVSPLKNAFMRPQILSRMRSFSTPLYLVALCFIGARINLGLSQIDEATAMLPKAPKLLTGLMGSSVWGGISIIVFSVSSQQSSFAQQRSLKQTSRSNTFAEDSAFKQIRRYGWLAASFLGLFASSLVNMAWGLVGYLAVPNGGTLVDIFSSLPERDRLTDAARLMTLITLLATLPASLRSARKALKRLFFLPQRAFVVTQRSLTHRKSKSAQLAKSLVLSSSEDEPSEDESVNIKTRRKRSRVHAWAARLAALLCWILTATLSVSFGHGDRLISLLEIVSCVGCTLMTFLLPAVFFIVLFHIRKARTIFVSDLTSPTIHQDALLMKKEQQLQRRLSGRRIWQDVGVFALAFPIGLVILCKGLVSIG